MKPVVYFDFKEINENEVVIGKARLKAILTEVYGAGVADGKNQKDAIPYDTTTTNAEPSPTVYTETYFL